MPAAGCCCWPSIRPGWGSRFFSGLLFHSFLNFFNRFRKQSDSWKSLPGLLMAAGAMLFFDMIGSSPVISTAG
jgi:hypothetical protein